MGVAPVPEEPREPDQRTAPETAQTSNENTAQDRSATNMACALMHLNVSFKMPKGKRERHNLVRHGVRCL
eukprot:1916212-Pyramimonas_sp.AAC.1